MLNHDPDFDFPEPAAPDTPKRDVPPLFLTPKEKLRADDLTPPGLSNPFWNS